MNTLPPGFAPTPGSRLSSPRPLALRKLASHPIPVVWEAGGLVVVRETLAMPSPLPSPPRRFVTRAVAAAATAALCAGTWAQVAPVFLPPDSVVITATRTPTSLNSAPGAVSVVTRAELENRNVKTLDEAVSQLPGVFSKRSKGLLDTQGSVQLRGLPGDDRTLILLDGLPLNDAYTGGVRLGGLSLLDAERVEVLRGPGSSLYGGSAVGGVVQVITRMPEATEARANLRLGQPLNSDFGYKNLRSAGAVAGTKIGDVSLRANLATTRTDGYRSDIVSTTIVPPAGISGAVSSATTTGGTTQLIGERGRNGFKDSDVGLAARWRITDDHALSLRLRRSDYEYSYGDPISYLQNSSGAPVFNYTNGASVLREASFTAGGGRNQRDTVQLLYEGRHGDARSRVSLASIESGNAQFITPNATTATRAGGPGRLTTTPSIARLLDAQWTQPLGTDHRLIVGTTLRRDEADVVEYLMTDWRDAGTRIGNPVLDSHGRIEGKALFAQDEWSLADGLTATLGLRYDQFHNQDGRSDDRTDAGVSKAGFPRTFADRKDSAVNPKLAIVWKFSDALTWRASAGTAFRAPTVFDLYRTYVSSAGTIFASNPDLKAERSRSYDVGLTATPMKDLQVSGSLFRTDLREAQYRRTVTDLTEARSICGATATTSNCRYFVNAGLTRSEGAELDVRQTLGTFQWFANATLLKTKVLDNVFAPASIGKRLVGVPNRIVNAGVSGDFGPMSLSMSGRSFGKAYRNDDNGDTVTGVHGATDPRTVFDAKVRWRIDRYFTASAAVDNLFDRKAYDFYRTAGRTLVLELNASY